jgi:hypothetical protein
MSMGWDYISEMRPPTGILFVPQMTYEYEATVEWYWQGNTKTSKKTCPIVI